MVGNFADVKTDEDRKKINQVTRWYKPWFFKHVETALAKVIGDTRVKSNIKAINHLFVPG